MDSEHFIVGGLTILFGIVAVAIYLAVIMLCGLGVEWVFDSFKIDIDKTIYWTGIALLILFCAFGKSKKEKD